MPSALKLAQPITCPDIASPPVSLHAQRQYLEAKRAGIRIHLSQLGSPPTDPTTARDRVQELTASCLLADQAADEARIAADTDLDDMSLRDAFIAARDQAADLKRQLRSAHGRLADIIETNTTRQRLEADLKAVSAALADLDQQERMLAVDEADAALSAAHQSYLEACRLVCRAYLRCVKQARRNAAIPGASVTVPPGFDLQPGHALRGYGLSGSFADAVASGSVVWLADEEDV
jgi:hypothetical protein